MSLRSTNCLPGYGAWLGELGFSLQWLYILTEARLGFCMWWLGSKRMREEGARPCGQGWEVIWYHFYHILLFKTSTRLKASLDTRASALNERGRKDSGPYLIYCMSTGIRSQGVEQASVEIGGTKQHHLQPSNNWVWCSRIFYLFKRRWKSELKKNILVDFIFLRQS